MPVSGYGRSFRRRRRRRAVVGIVRTRRLRGRMFGRIRRKYAKISATMLGFPTNQVVKMRYAQHINFNMTSSGAMQIHTFRANSIFDPDTDPSVTGKPLGYTQWNQFYERYTVLGSRMILSVVAGSAGQVPTYVGIYLSDDQSPTATNVVNLIEQGKSHYQVIQNATNGYLADKSISMNYSARKWHGCVDVTDADNLEADFGANPVDETYYVVYCATGDNTTPGPANISIMVQIDYIVRCKDPQELIP